jgi:hypothetical protein
VGSLALAAERRNSQRLQLHGVSLSGRTWYLTSVTRLGRTWAPQGLSTLRFTGDDSAVTFDGASATSWAVHFGGHTLRASVHGEREAGGAGPVSYQIGQAVESLLRRSSTVSLVGNVLSLSSSKGSLRYATEAPTPAPTGTISMRATESAAIARAVAATFTVRDAERLQLLQWAASAAGTTLGNLSTGTYTLTATASGASCSPVTVVVTSGQTVAATVLCRL